MTDLHALELVINVFLQTLGEGLVITARFFTFLGSEDFFFMVLPVIYWSISPALGLRVALILILSNGLNHALKLTFHSPRPYWIDPDVKALTSETSFGMPSNHAQTATAVWGLVGRRSGRAWGMIAALVITLLIGLSRLVLGVHFLSDVLVGWLVGGLLLVAFVRLDRPVRSWIEKQSFRQITLVSLALSLVLLLLLLGANAALGTYQVPDSWITNAVKAGAEAPMPRLPDDAFTLSGTLVGLCLGAAWMFKKAGGFEPLFDINRRVVSYLVGLVGVLLFWYVLGAVLPREADLLSYALRFARYTLVGLWISAGAPWIFKRLRLVK